MKEKRSGYSKKLVCIKQAPATGIYAQTNFEVFDFNTTTGVISNPIDTIFDYPVYCEFSPNGHFLYSHINGQVTQFDFNNINEEIKQRIIASINLIKFSINP